MKRIAGFTLVELMVTLAVVAIMATIALPGFWNLIQSNRVATQTNHLVSSLNVARSEAIRRGVAVWVTPQGGNFANGWCVHTDANCVAATRIREQPAMTQMVVTGSPNFFVFNRRGEKIAPAGTTVVRITPVNCSGNRVREVEILNTGRVRVERDDC